MKKTLSFFLSAILALSTLSLGNSSAAEDDFADLRELAVSLGAKTDHLNVVNYRPDDDHPVSDETYYNYLHNCTIIEALYYPADKYSESLMGGACVGITLVEVLAHNGVISPSDIQEDATYLSDISYNEASNNIILGYQAMQSYTEFDNYEKYLAGSIPYDEQVDKLIDSAKESMKNNKYFFISVRTERFNHAVCGIGISSGHWKWKEKDYDTCILTLDSNLSNTDGKAVGFSEQACIYINSETKESCVPIYDIYSNEDETLLYTSITDYSLLNFKGLINPSDKIETDISNLKQIASFRKDGIQIFAGYNSGEMVLDKRDIIFGSWGGDATVLNCDYIHINMNTSALNNSSFRYIDSERWVDIGGFGKEAGCKGTIDISDNEIKIINSAKTLLKPTVQLRMNEGTYSFSPYFWWTFQPSIDKGLSFDIVDDGILLHSEGKIDSAITAYNWLSDENGFYKFNGLYLQVDQILTAVLSYNDVLIKVENEKIQPYIDDNNDDVYDVPVQLGDVNCDGHIDAKDASEVLTIYSNLSTTEKGKRQNYYSFGDIDKNGKVNAIDASRILVEYAKLSTE